MIPTESGGKGEEREGGSRLCTQNGVRVKYREREGGGEREREREGKINDGERVKYTCTCRNK